jgi:hypothetical protein
MSQVTETEPSKGVKWDDPPPTGPRYDWPAISRRLRRRPGEWLLVFEKDKTSITTAIRGGRIRSMHPSNGIEVRTANNTRDYPRTCSLWLRYNPDNDKQGAT